MFLFISIVSRFPEMDDYPLLSEHDMNSLEEELEGENSVQASEIIWKNHFSNLTTESTTLLGSNMGYSSFLEGNTGFDHNTSLKPHASSQQKPIMSCILSFEESTSVPNIPKKTCHGEHSHEKSQKKRGRSCNQMHDHIMAERKRRENITRMFIALSALIPGLKKMDKVSVLSDAIDYVKFLKQRVNELEQEKKRIETIGCFKIDKTNVAADDYVSLDEIKICPKVEARVSGKDVLIRVMCEKQKDIVRKLLAKLEAHDLSVVCSNVLPFGNSALNVTSIAKVDHEFNIKVDNLVKMLTEDLLECCNLQQ
ncbi:hypothetical protein Fmac_028780 [Flemingia macrophylla]|uniref:BHLH domain-containing protein n=1 Tax=Flemingia macrophylla TaxID=520843 RepID=A0ABD1L8G7_9FABA